MSDHPTQISDDWHLKALELEQAMQRAVQRALWEHKQLGHSIVVWRDGAVVTVPPEEIPVEDPPNGVAAAD